MSFFIILFQRIGNLLRALIRILRKAFCCRRRQNDAEPLLPLTSLSNFNSTQFKSEFPDFHSWEDWGDASSSTQGNAVAVNIEQQCKDNEETGNKAGEAENNEDYFRDMVPQFRRAKKIIVSECEDSSLSCSVSSSNRLSMDPKAFLSQEAELGLLTDNSTTWELDANLDDIVDPESVIREKRQAEREKRIAEHQRRKQEKENRRASLNAAASLNAEPFHMLKDKSKHS